MDPRGVGLSDRLTEVPTLNERVADVLTRSERWASPGDYG